MKAFTILALVLAQIVAINAFCYVQIPVSPIDSTATITYIPSAGNCAGLQSPDNAFIDPVGYLWVYCQDICAFNLESTGNINYGGATTNCSSFQPGSYAVPQLVQSDLDCHGDCQCIDSEQDPVVFDIMVDVGSVPPASECVAIKCAFNDPSEACPAGPGIASFIVDTDPCSNDLDAQILAPCGECATGLPSPVNLFSLWVAEGNLNVGEFCTDIQGRAAVSGDANWCTSIGDQIAGPNTNNIPCINLIDYQCHFPWALVVGGNANLSGAVYGGDIWANSYSTFLAQKAHIGDKALPQMKSKAHRLAGRADPKATLLDSHLNKQDKPEDVDFQCLTFGPPTTPPPIDFGAMVILLRDYTFILDSQPRTGDVSSQGPVIKFRGTNTPNTEVFQLGCDAIGPDTRILQVENINPSVHAIIINVFCYPNPFWNLTSTNGFDMRAFEPYQSKVIWNVDNDNVAIANLGFRGTLLAPYAQVTANNGNFIGGVIAKDYAGTFQFNFPLFNGCPDLIYPPTAKKHAPYSETHIRPSRK